MRTSRGKREHGRLAGCIAKVLAISLTFLAIFVGAMISSDVHEAMHAEKYGGKISSVPVHVDKADSVFAGRFWTYSVKLSSTEPLADGSYMYESLSKRDYDVVSGHVGEDIVVIIGEDGHIMDVGDDIRER